jgi:hypothetical protein
MHFLNPEKPRKTGGVMKYFGVTELISDKV